MTDRELMQQALENCRLLAAKHRKEEWAQHILRFCEEAGVRPTALRARLAQPEQEPVAYMVETDGGVMLWPMHDYYEASTYCAEDEKPIPLYTAPPQREWVGLTDEELEKMANRMGWWLPFARAIEAKLKEKNNEIS